MSFQFVPHFLPFFSSCGYWLQTSILTTELHSGSYFSFYFLMYVHVCVIYTWVYVSRYMCKCTWTNGHMGTETWSWYLSSFSIFLYFIEASFLLIPKLTNCGYSSLLHKPHPISASQVLRLQPSYHVSQLCNHCWNLHHNSHTHNK